MVIAPDSETVITLLVSTTDHRRRLQPPMLDTKHASTVSTQKSPSSIFPIDSNSGEEETAADVAHDINILTHVLKRSQAGQSQRSPRENSRELAIWNHVSFSLDTGSSQDAPGSTVVAVTGEVKEKEVVAWVFTRNAKSEDKETGQTPEVPVPSYPPEIFQHTIFS